MFCVFIAVQFRYNKSENMEETQISYSADQVCNATQEALLAEGYKLVTICPLCHRRGIDLEVGCHRSAGNSC